MKNQVRVVIADDHPAVRAGLRLFVETDQSLSVVAEADSEPAAVAAVRRYRPAVLLLDSEMSDAGGGQLIRAIKQACAKVRILALTTFPDHQYARMLLSSGAEGCVSKLDGCDTLVRALKAVVVARKTRGACRRVPGEQRTRSAKYHRSHEMLTRRELDRSAWHLPAAQMSSSSPVAASRP